MEDIIKEVVKASEAAKHGRGVRIESRWFKMRRAFGGYPRGKLTLIGADPGNGKTTFVSNEISNCVLKGIPCAVASMEMTSEEWMESAICAEADLDAFKYQAGEFSDEEMERFNAMAERFKKAPLYINDKTHTIGSLCSFIRDMGTDRKCELIAFDYVQMIKSDTGHRSRNEEVGAWSNQIILTAKELPNTALIGISQFNRPVTGGKFQEPDLNRLRDSGSLGQDAYLVLLLYQDPHAGDEKLDDNAPTVIKVEKHRRGKSGKHILVFRKTNQKFLE
jgi:replicative DNA helicase